MERRPGRWRGGSATAALALLAALATAIPAGAEEAGPGQETLPEGKGQDLAVAAPAATAEPAPWRGSIVSLRTDMTLLTMQKDAELTYNPYVALSLDVRPRWYFGKIFYVALDFSMVHEFTNADDTTKKGETWVGDLNLGGGAKNFWTIPAVGIDLSADLRVITPTSKLSQARTMNAALRGGLTLARNFKLLDGLSIAYTLQGTGYFYRHTTSESEAPLISGCSADDGSCDRFRNSGVRNSWFRLGNGLTISMDFLPWLGLDVAVVHRLDWLYKAADDDPRVSYVPQEPQNRRQSLAYDIGLRFTPMKSLGIGIGVSTLNPLQSPDSSNYAPFVNRYTMGYLELTLNVDGLVDQIKGEKKR